MLYFSRYKLKYLTQFAEYNCNQGVLRKVTLSSKTYLFLILKVELHFKILTLKVEFVEKIVSITGDDILFIFSRFKNCFFNIKVEMSPKLSVSHNPY